MILYEKFIKIPFSNQNQTHFEYLKTEVEKQLQPDEAPVRLIITKSEENAYHCEIGILKGLENSILNNEGSIFSFKKRKFGPGSQFNVVLMIPTGIGAEIGGHAGDAGPVAKLFASLCDYLITHPNVVNASDINELPANGMYVEGSSLTRFLMGTIGLRKVRSNRILLIVDNLHEDPRSVNESINALNAARATYGLDCSLVVKLDPPLKVILEQTVSGRSSGTLGNLEGLIEALNFYADQYDAVALSTKFETIPERYLDYFLNSGNSVNPWGGLESLLTHTISLLYPIPSAHSPMAEFNIDPYDTLIETTIEPRLAAEWISKTYMQCILKGLQNSPKIITEPDRLSLSDMITANDISSLVIPDGCLGLPVLAALHQGITVIAVKENKNLMNNDLMSLPWKNGQFYRVENYLEAAGLLSAIKAGITPLSVRRPIEKATVVTHCANESNSCLN